MSHHYCSKCPLLYLSQVFIDIVYPAAALTMVGFVGIANFQLQSLEADVKEIGKDVKELATYMEEVEGALEDSNTSLRKLKANNWT